MAMAGQIRAAGLGFSISYYCSHQIAGSSARVQLVIVLYIIIDTDPCPSHTAGCSATGVPLPPLLRLSQSFLRDLLLLPASVCQLQLQCAH